MIFNSSVENIEVYFSDKMDVIIRERARTAIRSVPFVPPFYTVFDYHGQLQTLVQFIFRNALQAIKATLLRPWSVRFSREILFMEDGGSVGLDWVYFQAGILSLSPPVKLSNNSPVVILHHGLVGDSESEYICHLAEMLTASGYRVVVMVARGCGGLKLTSPFLFAGRRTDDVHATVAHVHKRYPKAKLFWIGFSLGAALTIQYLADYRENCLLTAAMSVSPPWNTCRNATKPSLIATLWTSMLSLPLKIHYLKHYSYMMDKHPAQFNIKYAAKVLSTWKMSEFDDLMFPTFYKRGGGAYMSVEEYYQDISPDSVAYLVKTPLLALSAKDDPICMHEHCPTTAESMGEGLVIIKTPYGGHLAFPEGILPLTRAWTDQVAVEWFNSFASNG